MDDLARRVEGLVHAQVHRAVPREDVDGGRVVVLIGPAGRPPLGRLGRRRVYAASGAAVSVTYTILILYLHLYYIETSELSTGMWSTKILCFHFLPHCQSGAAITMFNHMPK